MTAPTPDAPAAGAPPPMTPERWRMVDAILQAALACEPARRDAVVAAADHVVSSFSELTRLVLA